MTVQTFFANSSSQRYQSGGTSSWNSATTGINIVTASGPTAGAVGQELNGGVNYFVYQAALWFDTSIIPTTATISAATLSLSGAGSAGSAFIIYARNAYGFVSINTAGLPLLAAYTAPLAVNTYTASSIGSFGFIGKGPGGAAILHLTSNRDTNGGGAVPTGQEYAVVEMVSPTAKPAKLVVTYNSAPAFSGTPFVNFAGTPKRASANNPTIPITFTPTDPDQPFGYDLTMTAYIIDPSGVTRASGSVNTGSSNTINLTYSSSYLSNGSNPNWYIILVDQAGYPSPHSNVFSIPVDTDFPIPSGGSITTSPTTVGSNKTYSVNFTPVDATSLNGGELFWAINTNSTDGLTPSHTLKPLTAVTTGTLTNSGSIVDSVLPGSGSTLRYLYLRDGANNYNYYPFTVVTTLPPSFSVQPTISYQPGATRTGPLSTPFVVSFAAADSDTGTLSWTVLDVTTGSNVLASGTVAPGVPVNASIAYNVVNDGDTLAASISDGPNIIVSNLFTVGKDVTAPTSSTPGYSGLFWTSYQGSPVAGPSATYDLKFIPNDNLSGQTLTYEYYRIDSGSTHVTISQGTCVAGSLRTVSGVSDVVAVSNTRYLVVTDTALNTTTTTFSFIGTTSSPANFVIQTAAASSSTSLSLKTTPLLSLAVAASSSTSLALSTQTFFVISGVGATATPTLALAAPSIFPGGLRADGSSTVTSPVSTSVALSSQINGTATASLGFSVPARLTMSADGLAVPSSNLDLTPGPVILTLSVAGGSTSTANLDATHIVAFLTLVSVVGMAVVSGNLDTTPHLANLVIAQTNGLAAFTNPSFLLEETPRLGPEFPSLRADGTSSVTLGVISNWANLYDLSLLGEATATLTLTAGMARSVLLYLESEAQVVSDIIVTPLESTISVTTSNIFNVEAMKTTVTEVSIFGLESLQTQAWGNLLPLEAHASLARNALVPVESQISLINLTVGGTIRVESLGQPEMPQAILIEARGAVSFDQLVPLEILEGIWSNLDTQVVESLHIIDATDAILPLEILTDGTATVTIPLGFLRNIYVDGAHQVEVLYNVITAGYIPIGTVQGITTNGVVPVEAKGYALSIAPNAFTNLTVRKNMPTVFLKVHRIQSKTRVLKATPTGDIIVH